MITEVAYAPSRTPYALALDRFSVGKLLKDQALVPAIWVTRRDRKTRVSIGHLWAYGVFNVQDFMRYFDGRYGGTCAARWDGRAFWTNGALDPSVHDELLVACANAYNKLPDVPTGYTGWYSIK